MRTPLATPRVAHLFLPMRAELVRILRGLSAEQWNLPTVCPDWSVQDVALHLLGDDVGLLSGLRDADPQRRTFETFADLVNYVNGRNAVWVDASRRISRNLVLSLLEFTGAQWADYAASVDAVAPGGPIGWTGNAHDPMGLHIAREFTEYWMHHQHIAEAVGVVSLKDAVFLGTAISTFVHCLPRSYRDRSAPRDTLVKVVITGTGGGEWHLVREDERWRLYANTDLSPACTVSLSADTAWRLFTKGLTRDALPDRIQIEGSQELGQVIWNAVAILA